MRLGVFEYGWIPLNLELKNSHKHRYKRDLVVQFLFSKQHYMNFEFNIFTVHTQYCTFDRVCRENTNILIGWFLSPLPSPPLPSPPLHSTPLPSPPLPPLPSPPLPSLPSPPLPLPPPPSPSPSPTLPQPLITFDL